MKKYLLLLFMFISFQAPKAQQVWVNHGAEWHYNWTAISGFGYQKIVYEKDSMVLGKYCQALHDISYRYTTDQHNNVIFLGIYDGGYRFTYLSGDTLYYLQNNQFHVLYYFGAQAGDTWDVGTGNANMCGSSIVKVDSIGQMFVNNQTSRLLYLSTPAGSSGAISSRVVDRWGGCGDGIAYLFTTIQECDPNLIIDFPIYHFSCFIDSVFPLYNATNGDCEISLDGITDPDSRDGILAWPNPANTFISVQSLEGQKIMSVNIFDQQGRRRLETIDVTEKIDVSEFSAGIYLVNIVTQKGVENRKLVISR